MHIPIPEYLMIYNEGEYYGRKGEEICCSSINTGLFAAVQETRAVDWIGSGHDHDNDFFGELQGVKLAYGRKTGMGGYGPDHLKRGARVYEVSISPDSLESYQVKTYIR